MMLLLLFSMGASFACVPLAMLAAVYAAVVFTSLVVHVWENLHQPEPEPIPRATVRRWP